MDRSTTSVVFSTSMDELASLESPASSESSVSNMDKKLSSLEFMSCRTDMDAVVDGDVTGASFFL